MKDLVLFIISLVLGIGIVFGYSILKTQNNLQKQVISKKSPASTFSIDTPPSESLKGSIASRSGTLLCESRIASSPGKLEDTIQIQQGERLLTEDKSSATVNFAQVGSFELADNSDLSLFQTLPVDLVVCKRNLYDSGFFRDQGIPNFYRQRSFAVYRIFNFSFFLLDEKINRQCLK